MNAPIYSVYLYENCVELREGDTGNDCDIEGFESESARFICSQKNYRSIFDFASNLAKYKQLLFVNHARDLEE